MSIFPSILDGNNDQYEWKYSIGGKNDHYEWKKPQMEKMSIMNGKNNGAPHRTPRVKRNASSATHRSPRVVRALKITSMHNNTLIKKTCTRLRKINSQYY